jgi:hypothetical protein
MAAILAALGAVIVFLLIAFGVTSSVNLTAVGLALFAGAFLLSLILPGGPFPWRRGP